jgi:murein DD-endopeptidase MepM/ murein hydrolase activator NlpD
MYRNTARLESRRQRAVGTWIVRVLSALVLLAVAGVATAWYLAGRAEGPRITIMSPGRAIGSTGELDVLVESPRAQLDRLDVVFEQSGTRTTLFDLQSGGSDRLTPAGENRLRLLLPVGKAVLPQLQDGRASVSVGASRPVLFGLRHAQSRMQHPFEVRLTPPRVSVLSRFHHIGPGGSEAVVYEVSRPAVSSGVRVGDKEYPGFPASGAGVAHADVGLRVAFFALAWDADPATRIHVFARDDVGNQAEAGLDVKMLPRRFRQGRIELDDGFFAKVVPAILQRSPDLKVESGSDMLASFLRINGELRTRNGDEIAAIARGTAPEILWTGPFRQLANSAVEGSFADQRTYFYKGREVDRQVHLGYDLASTASAKVVAANRGKVVHAGWLGIYGNCVIVDHGMGLQSLYAHFSSVDVSVGSMVEAGALLGRTGSTGLAGGDHLHFTMLLGGTPVTPLEWWSPKWVQDRILRKLREAEALGTGQRGSSVASP